MICFQSETSGLERRVSCECEQSPQVVAQTPAINGLTRPLPRNPITVSIKIRPVILLARFLPLLFSRLRFFLASSGLLSRHVRLRLTDDLVLTRSAMRGYST